MTPGPGPWPEAPTARNLTVTLADALERGLRRNTVLSQLLLAHNDLETATDITERIDEVITRNAEAHKLTGTELGSLERDEL